MQKKKRKSKLSSALVYTNRTVEMVRKRRLIALFCQVMGNEILAARGFNRVPSALQPLANFTHPPTASLDEPSASCNGTIAPRQIQTLELLLKGLSEKEVAKNLQISRHTVHVYIKSLYKRFKVTSRAELLAKWVKK